MAKQAGDMVILEEAEVLALELTAKALGKFTRETVRIKSQQIVSHEIEKTGHQFEKQSVRVLSIVKDLLYPKNFGVITECELHRIARPAGKDPHPWGYSKVTLMNENGDVIRIFQEKDRLSERAMDYSGLVS